MDIGRILQEIDVLYSQQKVEEVEELVLEKIAEFKQNKEIYPTIMLINELLGIYREKGDKQKALDSCSEVLAIFSDNNMPKDENYATTLLNVATAYRVFGDYDLAKNYYNDCIEIYNKTIDKNDFRLASLYNNLSLLFVEKNEPKKAIENIEKSLDILYNNQDVEVPIATANTSLAQIYMGMNDIELAKKHIDIALKIYEGFDDYHHSAALSTAADIAYTQADYELSIKLYKEAMSVIERYIGKTQNYFTLEENLKKVEKLLNSTGLKLCKDFYNEFGLPMIEKNFKNYIDKMAIGLVGHGSECFGFDDEISKDHDYGAGFCIWLTDDVYNEIGEQLQSEYDKLPTTYQGITRTVHEHCANEKRLGVFKISDFYKSIIGVDSVPSSDKIWLSIEESALAQATNGEVFIDNLGEFSKFRNNLINHYPKDILVNKISQKAHLVSQTGQYNLVRTLKRNDLVTSRIILSEFISNTIDLIFLLNKTYTPFYKWKFKKLKELSRLSDIADDIEKLQLLSIDDTKVIDIIEDIVSKIIVELKNQGYIPHDKTDNFLDLYIGDILSELLQNNSIFDKKMKLIELIVSYEWKEFDKVQNIDGRATCQDDYNTFNIMRSSQFMAWTTDLLQSYINDFEAAMEINRNLITEKYAVMMKTTDYDSYKEFEPQLPKLSQEQLDLIEEIVAKQVNLMASLRPIYPKLSQNSRILRTSEDTMYDTSYETYLRGELSTHSLKTNKLYNELLDSDIENGINTVMLYMQNTAKLYGYDDLDSAEASL